MNSRNEIYLDYNATTPIDRRALDATSFAACQIGNAASRDYCSGWMAAQAIEDAREEVAEFICSPPSSIVFTSGATEGLSAVIRSFVGRGERNVQKTIVTCDTEHAAVLRPSTLLASQTNTELSLVSGDSSGRCSLELLRDRLKRRKKSLVAIMGANNEIGTVQPIAEICQIVHENDSYFLCDLTQAIGKLPVDLSDTPCEFAVFSSHKLYGPMGVGAMVLQDRTLFDPLIFGDQECGLRGGTLNVPGIVGFGEACRIAKDEMESDNRRIIRLRDRLEATLLAELPDIWINGAGAERLCNTSNIGFRGVDARTMIRDMHDIACSTKSACSSGDSRPSHVLKAIGLTDDEAYSCIRFSLGRFTTEQEIDYALEKIIGSVRKLRRIAGSAGMSPTRRPT